MEQIKSIFYKEIAYPYSNNQYGLAIIIMMQKKCLYFDSSSFYFVKSPSDNFNKQKWNIVSDLNDNKIAAIHEDELYKAWNDAVRNIPFGKIEPLR